MPPLNTRILLNSVCECRISKNGESKHYIESPESQILVVLFEALLVYIYFIFFVR